MRRDEDFFQQFEGHTLFTGVCEARNDPAMMGRIQVRIFGLHSPDRTEIPTESLPWATIMLPTTMAGMSGIGATTSGIMEGTWVVGFFRDGPSCQDPIIIGTLLGNASARWPALSRDSLTQPPERAEQTGVAPSPDEPKLTDKEKEAKDEIEKDGLTKIFDKIKEKWDSLSLAKKMSELSIEDKEIIEEIVPFTTSVEDTVSTIAQMPDKILAEIQKNKTSDLEDIQKVDKDLITKTKDLKDEDMETLIAEKKKME